MTDSWANDTLSTLVFNVTTVIPDVATMSVAPKRHVTFASQLVLTLVYITGVIGNVSALIILFHRDKVICRRTEALVRESLLRSMRC